MTLIDLDQPGPEAAARPPSRPRLALGALALVLAGSVLGGVVVFRWQQERAADARRSAVSLVVLPDMLQRPGDSVQAGQTDGRQAVDVGVNGHVNVINTGPVPVRFLGYRADLGGVQLQGQSWLTPNQLIPAGGSVVGTFHATVRCDSDLLTQPVPAVFDVVTTDGVHRKRTVSLDARAWAEQVAVACAQPWTRSLAGRGQ
jgi:hypothetical protein